MKPLPLYVFIHIPKCAGTSIKTILEENIKNTYRYPRGVEPECGWENVNCIHGHFTPIEPILRREFKNRDFKYYTLLRHPVDRTISYYNFSMGTHILERVIPFEKWINNDDGATHMKFNTMCYYLGNGEKNQVHKVNLKIAMHQLKNEFELFSTVDKMRTFINFLKWQLNIKPKRTMIEDFQIPWENKTKKQFVRRGEFDDLIIQKNDLDMELWGLANELIK
jgi:hypothetical protein